ncbi:uncharacterized protein LOC123313237 [Coccinella septempunctata]|uniref:uncharacterized protein LOC123313237 n=1 Tax=Coccinella septempunctata TaxID=41139 RepID=UPI001D076B0E|nr:uncharacterized protein LOC123313237 [Coccinella septempunctata]
MSIKGAIKYGYLHVCKLDPSLKPEALVEHLNTNGFNNIICEKLESKRPEEYSSFKLTVPAQNFEEIKNPALWPEAVTEHWQSTAELEALAIDGFKLASKYCRPINCHGECAVYCRDGIVYKERFDFVNISIPYVFECSAIETTINNVQLTIISIYRPNSYPRCDINLFFEKLYHLLEKLTNSNSHYIIAGDFNINILANTSETQKFISILEGFGASLSVHEPTRITSNSATCIDNFITNLNSYDAIVVPSHISDHTSQLLSFPVGEADFKSVPKQIRLINVIISDEVIRTAKAMENKGSFGYEGIPMTVIKRSIEVVARPVAHIMYMAFKEGVFPESLKIAVVKPFYKKGNRDDLDNYRPISLLTSFSKLFEKVLTRSTETAIFELTRSILRALEGGEISAGLFLDFSKAFDCVIHDILIDKLYSYGIRDKQLDLIRSYLEGRVQRVSMEIDGAIFISDDEILRFGVPQGSIAGPLFFLVYINDLPEYIFIEEPIMMNAIFQVNAIDGEEGNRYMIEEKEDGEDVVLRMRMILIYWLRLPTYLR